MTSSFERKLGAHPAPRDPGTRSRMTDAPGGGGPRASAAESAPNAYARFIPREEVRSFAAWTPGSFGATSQNTAAAAAPPLTPEGVAAQLQAARQSGYQDGYRDGLTALEGFKQSYAQQVTGQAVAVAQAFRGQLQQLEQGLATQLAGVAIALARQVLRSELTTRPELVAAVAQEALAATLASAKQVAVHVHPDDHALLSLHAGEALAARGARLVPDAAMARGGCVVDSDVGIIDASVEARWRRAMDGMGQRGAHGVAPPAVDPAATPDANGEGA
ncbi:FliH/SctL family protein [Methylibium sp.]|uniref:FliH/SctL family protein n=1 Tax=Methylibium sp. TaxID=2067992 RepID=UPI003D0D80C3